MPSARTRLPIIAAATPIKKSSCPPPSALVEDAHAYESLRVYQEEQQSFLNAAWRRGFLSAAWRLLLGGSGGCGSSRSSPPSSRASSPPPKRLAAEDRAVIDRIDQMLAAWKFEEAKERAEAGPVASVVRPRAGRT